MNVTELDYCTHYPYMRGCSSVLRNHANSPTLMTPPFIIGACFLFVALIIVCAIRATRSSDQKYSEILNMVHMEEQRQDQRAKKKKKYASVHKDSHRKG